MDVLLAHGYSILLQGACPKKDFFGEMEGEHYVYYLHGCQTIAYSTSICSLMMSEVTITTVFLNFSFKGYNTAQLYAI